MSNARPLKAYIRYDGSGRAVSSSLIWRKNKPKVGTWVEVQGYECCNGEITLSFELSDSFPIVDVDFVLYTTGTCGDGSYGYNFHFTGVTVNTIGELIGLLNSKFSTIGKFSVQDDGVTINLRLTSATANQFTSGCPLSFEVFAD